MLDVAEDVRAYRLRRLEEEMGTQGELATDLSGDLWQQRVRQLDGLLPGARRPIQ
jgi:hypothetical protein